jgi:hypothetical protein
LEAGNLRQAVEGILDYVGWEVMGVIEVEDCIPVGVGMDYNSSSLILNYSYAGKGRESKGWFEAWFNIVG